VALDYSPDWENDPNCQPDLQTLETNALEFFINDFLYVLFIRMNEKRFKSSFNGF